jgi:hypothetical protein
MGKGVHECVLDTRFISEMAMRLASVIFLTYVGKRALSRAKMQLMVLRPYRDRYRQGEDISPSIAKLSLGIRTRLRHTKGNKAWDGAIHAVI